MSSCIYLLTNTLNQKQYVGFASDYDERMKFYAREANEHRYLTNSIRKHGWAAFTSEIIYMSNDAVHCKDEAEVALIASYNTFKGRGYNLTAGGEGTLGRTYKHTVESKAKMRKSHLGKKLTESAKEKLRLIKLSPERKKQISESLKGRICKPETRAKISASQIGKHVPVHIGRKISKAKTLPVPKKEHLIDMLKSHSTNDVISYYEISLNTLSIWKRNYQVRQRDL